MKVFKIFPLLLVFLGLIPSCRCPEVDPYFKPTEMSITSIWNGSLYDDFEDLTIDEAEGFELWLAFTKKEYLSENTISFSLAQQALATQPCPDDGEQGLKHKATAIEIRSNAAFQETEAGENLNQFFHIMEYDQNSEQGNPEYITAPVENVLTSLNNPYSFEIAMALSELPNNDLAHTFTVELSFADGSSLIGVSSEVQF